jgi:hypothetical protein
LKALGCAGQRGKAGGPGVGAEWREASGEERGGPERDGDNSGSRHRPPVGGRGWHRCRARGEGGKARVTLARVADRWDQETTGPGGQWLGAGREWEGAGQHGEGH